MPIDVRYELFDEFFESKRSLEARFYNPEIMHAGDQWRYIFESAVTQGQSDLINQLFDMRHALENQIWQLALEGDEDAEALLDQFNTQCHIDVSHLSLFTIIDFGSAAVLQYKLEDQNTDPNVFYEGPQGNQPSKTPLIHALTTEAVEMTQGSTRATTIKRLLQHPQIDVNQINSAGQTAITAMIEKGAQNVHIFQNEMELFQSYLLGINALFADSRIDFSIDNPLELTIYELTRLIDQLFLPSCFFYTSNEDAAPQDFIAGAENSALFFNTVFFPSAIFFLLALLQKFRRCGQISEEEWTNEINPLVKTIYDNLQRFSQCKHAHELANYIRGFFASSIEAPFIRRHVTDNDTAFLPRTHSFDDGAEGPRSASLEATSRSISLSQVVNRAMTPPLIQPTAPWKRYIVSAAVGIATMGLYPNAQFARTALHYLNRWILPRWEHTNPVITERPRVEIANEIEAVFENDHFSFLEKFRTLHTHGLMGMTLVTRDESNNLIVPKMRLGSS